MLDDLLAATHEDGSPLDDREVRDALITILIAGHDTTALALAWALAEIVPRPGGRRPPRATSCARVTGGGPPEAEHLPALEYLDAAIRESLRLRPVAPFVVRKTVRPFAAGGREYPAGVVLCPCSYLVHRREDLYPDPERFRPERFLERKFGPHEWFPFGGGNRVCLGMPFALYEMKVLLATLLSQVRLTRPAGARSRARRYGIVLGPDDDRRWRAVCQVGDGLRADSRRTRRAGRPVADRGHRPHGRRRLDPTRPHGLAGAAAIGERIGDLSHKRQSGADRGRAGVRATGSAPGSEGHDGPERSSRVPTAASTSA